MYYKFLRIMVITPFLVVGIMPMTISVLIISPTFNDFKKNSIKVIELLKETIGG